MFSARLGFFYTYTPLVQDVVAAHTTSPFVTTYAWTDGSGFGSKYTNPGTLPGAAQTAIRMSPDNTMMLLGQSTTPFTNAYKWTLGTGFGTKYSNPGTALTVAVTTVKWTNNTNIIFTLNSTPLITAYAFTFASGYGTRYGAPATAPAGTPNDSAVNSAGNCVAVVHATTPYITVWAYTSGTGFGTKFTNPASLGTTTGRGVGFITDSYLSYIDNNNLRTYNWNNSTGFGSLAAAIAGTGSTGGQGVTKATAGATDRVVYTYGSNMGISNNPAGSIDGTQSFSGTTPVMSNVSGYQYAVGLGWPSTPYIRAYPLSQTTTAFGTRYADPGTTPTGQVNDMAWTNPQ